MQEQVSHSMGLRHHCNCHIFGCRRTDPNWNQQNHLGSSLSRDRYLHLDLVCSRCLYQSAYNLHRQLWRGGEGQLEDHDALCCNIWILDWFSLPGSLSRTRCEAFQLRWPAEGESHVPTPWTNCSVKHRKGTKSGLLIHVLLCIADYILAHHRLSLVCYNKRDILRVAKPLWLLREWK